MHSIVDLVVKYCFPYEERWYLVQKGDIEIAMQKRAVYQKKGLKIPIIITRNDCICLSGVNP